MMDPIKNLKSKSLLTENIYIFYTVVTLLLFSSCNSIERDCSKFRTGKFLTQTEINDTTYSSVFTRNGNIQIENFNNSIDSSACRWINDCELVLRTLNPKSKSELKNIHIKILTTTDSSYTYEYSFVGEKRKEIGMALKIGD